MVQWWSQIHFVLLTCLLSHLLWWSCGDPSNHFTAYLFRNCYWVNTTAGDGGICVLSFMLWLLHQIHIFKKSVSPPNITLEWPACVCATLIYLSILIPHILPILHSTQELYKQIDGNEWVDVSVSTLYLRTFWRPGVWSRLYLGCLLKGRRGDISRGTSLHQG